MYFNLEGDINGAAMLSENGGYDSEKFCRQIMKNKIKITGTETCSAVKEWKTYYLNMHPTQNLNEDVADKDLTDEEISDLLKRFFFPMSADSCCVTIVDPYLFASHTDSALLSSILKENVTSKKLRIITTRRNIDSSIKNSVISDLKANGFDVKIIKRNDIHDRWWYSRVSGFTCGTSFNGFGKNKMTTIKLLDQTELNAIIDNFGC